MDERVEAWRKRGDYLPDIMRDFHDQKDIFKSIHDTTAVEKHEYVKDVSWASGQCYVIDIFLWWMARHGYVLRKSNAAMSFDDLNDTLARAKAHRDAKFAEALGLTPIQKPST